MIETARRSSDRIRVVKEQILVAGRVDALVEITGVLREKGVGVDVSFDLDRALSMLDQHAYGALLCDLDLPGGGGLRMLEVVSRRPKPVQVILITRHGERQALVAALRAGAFDYIEEPFEPHDVQLSIERALEYGRLNQRRRLHEERLENLERALRHMNEATTVAGIFEVLDRELPRLLGITGFSLFEYDGDVLHPVHSNFERPNEEALPLYLKRQPGPMREAAMRGQPVVFPSETLSHVCAVCPVFVQEGLSYMMLIERSHPFDEDELTFFQAVSSHFGSGIKVRDRTAALEQALRDLRAAQAGLVRSERIAAVGKLASGIAHELKNPLTSMTFAVRNLLDASSARGDKERQTLEMLADDIRRMRDRVQTFLAVARPPEGHMQRCLVAEVVRRVLTRFRENDRSAQVRLEEQLEPGLAVLADEDQLFAAITNLVLNAVEALAGQTGGVVRIELSRAELGVRLSISDNGPGIPPEVQERIFDVFFTTKAGGSGLGLSQVFVFAERCGGRAWLANSERGACFVIDLPMAMAEARA